MQCGGNAQLAASPVTACIPISRPDKPKPMAITQQDVDRIARLAYLEFTPEQTERLQSEFSGILTLIKTLQSVDTTGVEPMAHPLSGHQDVALRLRDDSPRPAAT